MICQSCQLTSLTTSDLPWTDAESTKSKTSEGLTPAFHCVTLPTVNFFSGFYMMISIGLSYSIVPAQRIMDTVEYAPLLLAL